MRRSAAKPATDEAKPATDDLSLRLLATSDVHACLLGWNYLADRPSTSGGLARIATMVARLRNDADITLLVDNGDFLQGSPLGDAAARRMGLAPGDPHPVIAAMNRMGYDAAALGNHEFSNGLGTLNTAIAATQFPLLSANILVRAGADPGCDETLLAPSLLLHRQVAGHPPIAIGLVGLTPPRTLQWEASRITCELKARDMTEAAAWHAADLRRRGADLVIALCHSGFGAAAGEPASAGDADRVAGLPGIDAVVAGHVHQTFPAPERANGTPTEVFDPVAGRVHGKPVVMPGFEASHLGVIDFRLARQKGAWRIADSTARLEPVARRDSTGRRHTRVPEDPAILHLAGPVQNATRDWLGQVVGRNSRRLTSHFALVRPSALLGLLAQVKVQAVREALAGTEHAALPVLAAVAPYRAGGYGGPENYSVLPEDTITLRHLADLYPHPNKLVALRLTGAQLAAWLEASARVFRRVAPGSCDGELIDPGVPSSCFDVIDGLSYAIDLSVAAQTGPGGAATAGRIRDLRLNGAPLAPDRPVILATNDFRLTTTSRAGGTRLADHIVRSDLGSVRDALRRHIQACDPLQVTSRPQWRFVPMPGTSVLFDSAPEADPGAPRPGVPRIERLDLAPSGFRRFRLHL